MVRSGCCWTEGLWRRGEGRGLVWTQQWELQPRRSTLIPYGGPRFITSSLRATISGSHELCLTGLVGLLNKGCGDAVQRAPTFMILRRDPGAWAGSSGERHEHKLKSPDLCGISSVSPSSVHDRPFLPVNELSSSGSISGPPLAEAGL